MDEANKSIEHDFNQGLMLILKGGGTFGAKSLDGLFQKLAKSGKLALPPTAGKQTLKSLTKSKDPLSSIEITGDRIASFEKIAKKYGVAYSVMREKQPDFNIISKESFASGQTAQAKEQAPEKWLVYFKAKDVEIINTAFREYTTQQLKVKAKPSLHERLAKIKTNLSKKPAKNIEKTAPGVEKIIDAVQKDLTKHLGKAGPSL